MAISCVKKRHLCERPGVLPDATGIFKWGIYVEEQQGRTQTTRKHRERKAFLGVRGAAVSMISPSATPRKFFYRAYLMAERNVRGYHPFPSRVSPWFLWFIRNISFLRIFFFHVFIFIPSSLLWLSFIYMLRKTDFKSHTYRVTRDS